MKTQFQTTAKKSRRVLQLAKAFFCSIVLLILVINTNAAQICSDSRDQVFLNIIGKNQQITAKAEDFNYYWIGTNNGLWIINKHTAGVRHMVQGSVLPSNHITAICVTPDENVYVSTDKGIFRFDGYSYMIVSSENSGLPTDNITSMTCDNEGNLWLGTKDKGLVEMNNYRCRVFNITNSALTDNAVKKVLKDEDGNISAVLANQSVVKIGMDGIRRCGNDLAQKEK